MNQQDNGIKILFLQLGTIGDMVLATPAFRLIKDKFPNCKLDVICGSRNFAVIEDNPLIDSKIILDKSPFKLIKFIYKLREINYHYYIDPKPHFSRESRIIAKLVKASKKIGFNTAEVKNFKVENEQPIHFTLEVLNSLNELGIEIPGGRILPEIYLNKDSEQYVEHFLSNNGIKDYILINISASKEHKQWVIEKWIQLINYLIEQNYTLVLCFAPPEKLYAIKIYENCDKIFLFNSRSIKDIYSLVSRTKLLISPDTSLIHIAAAFDKPILGLYSGMTKFNKRFAPLSSLQVVINAVEGVDSIKGITLEEVIFGFEKIKSKI